MTTDTSLACRDGAAPTKQPGVWNRRRISRSYNATRPTWDRLEREALFILNHACLSFGERVYSIKSRVKTLDSVVQKTNRKQLVDPLGSIRDFVGLRVVCLYRSDLGDLQEQIASAFDVVEFHDKAADHEDPSVFDYESLHFIVRLPPKCGGPRYDGLVDRLFEIQLRTLAMDSWATISHNLSYKKGWDIPEPLLRDFHAVAALLHLADKHFDDVYRHVAKQRAAAATALSAQKPRFQTKISPYSLDSYVKWKLPDRPHSSGSDIGDLAQALLDHGVRTLGALNRLVDHGLESALHLERSLIAAGQWDDETGFWDVGIVRMAVRYADPAFEEHDAIRSDELMRDSARQSIPFSVEVLSALIAHLTGLIESRVDCDNSLRGSIAFLRQQGVQDIDGAVEWLEDFGGYCDCEVLLNVAALMQDEGSS